MVVYTAKGAEMTDLEKREFLEREGWKPNLFTGWAGVQQRQDGTIVPFDDAVRIASNRKAARERARLMKAGVYRCWGGKWHDDSFSKLGCNKGRCLIGGTRQEAIAYLDGMEGKE